MTYAANLISYATSHARGATDFAAHEWAPIHLVGHVGEAIEAGETILRPLVRANHPTAQRFRFLLCRDGQPLVEVDSHA